MSRRKALTMREIENIIDDWSDEEDEIAAITIVPPDRVDEQSDEEYLDEDFIVQHEDPSALTEVAGYFEIETQNDRGTDEAQPEPAQVPEPSPVASTSSGPPPKKQKTVYKSLSSFCKPVWGKNRNRTQFVYDIGHVPQPLTEMQQQLCEQLKGHSPLDLFHLFYDNEVLNYIMDETKRYASQQNVDFSLTMSLLKRFLGILMLSGYHTLPGVPDYWSTRHSLGVAMVKQAMTRTTFKHIKRFVHFADNDDLDRRDKMTKVHISIRKHTGQSK